MPTIPCYPGQLRCEDSNFVSFTDRWRRRCAMKGSDLSMKWNVAHPHPDPTVFESTIECDVDGDGTETEIDIVYDLSQPWAWTFPIIFNGSLVFGLKTGVDQKHFYVYQINLVTGAEMTRIDIDTGEGEANGMWQSAGHSDLPAEGELVAVGKSLVWMEFAQHPTAWVRKLPGV